MVDKFFDPKIDILQIGGHEFAADDRPRSGPTIVAPSVAVLVGRVINIGVVPDAKIDHIRRPAAIFAQT